MPCADGYLEDLGFYAMHTCEGLDAHPPSDACERAEKQLTALLLNVCSDRLQGRCQVDLIEEGCVSEYVDDLLDELSELIHMADCRRAAACAAAVNEGDALVDGDGGRAAVPRTHSPERKSNRGSRPSRVDLGARR
jgi:hypothetical protein